MKAKFIILFCIGAAMAAMAAEEPMAGTWSLAGNGKQRQGWSTNGTPLTTVAVVWTNASVSASGLLWGGAPKMGSAVTDNDRLYLSANSVAANNNGNIMALDLTTGTLLWGTKLSYIYAMGTPVVTANRVYASENNDTGPGVLACLDKTTGAIIWSNAVNQIVGGALQLSDGKVYCGSKWGVEAGMHCYDAEVGTQMWLYTGANGVDNSSVSQGVQYWTDTGAALNPAGTVLYFRSERLGKIVGIDAITGMGLYSNQYFNTVSSEGCQPVVDNAGNVYSGFDGVSAAGDPDIVVKFSPTLSQIWIYTFASDLVWGGRGAFALSPDQKTLYCANAGASGTGVTALNTADGTKKWDAGCGPTSGGIVVGAPSNIIVGVFTASGIATAKGLRDNGASVSTLWAVPLAPNTGWMGSSGSNPLLLPDGDVIVETAYGLIARIAYSPYVSPTNQLTTTFSWYAGAVAANPAGIGGWYNIGDAVTLTATAAAGFTFGGWGGDVSGMQNPLIVTMDMAKTVSATFNQNPIAFIDSNVWETFNSPFWGDAPWYGTSPNSLTRQFYYTNVEGRSCLADYVPNCGSNAQFHNDWGLFPQVLSNKTTCVYSVYTPDMGQPYTVRGTTKNENDTDNANTGITVNAAGWQTIDPAIINPEMALCIWWLTYGGFPGDLGIPAGQSPTFFVDEMRVTGGSGPDMLVDDFTVNPTWVSRGTWQQSPREWRYDPNSDFSRLWWPDHWYSVNTFDPSFTTTGLCMSLTFDAMQSASNYARAWIPSWAPCLADLSAAMTVEADVMVSQSNTPVAIWFKSGGEVLTAYSVQQPAGWQHLSWSIPAGGGVGWTNVQQVGVMVRTEGNDAAMGQLFLDNITFLTVPEPGVLALLVGALALLRRPR